MYVCICMHICVYTHYTQVYQLTWQTHTCFVYELESFDLLQQFNYDQIGLATH